MKNVNKQLKSADFLAEIWKFGTVYKTKVVWYGFKQLKMIMKVDLISSELRPKSTLSRFFHTVDFIIDLTFWSRTYSESPQNSRSYDILHVYVVSILAANFYKNQVYNFNLSTLYTFFFFKKKRINLRDPPWEYSHIAN